MFSRHNAIVIVCQETSPDNRAFLATDLTNKLYVTVASNHTDHELEAVSVGKSKQVCDKVLDDIIKNPILERELNMHIALIQMAVIAGDKTGNYNKVKQLVNRAVDLHPTPDIIVLPELWSTGYALKDLHTLASDEGNEEATFLGELAQKHNVWFAGGSVAAKNQTGIFNRAQIINRSGELTVSYDKIHLVPMLSEHKYLKAGNSHCVHEIEGISFGFAICYDIRFCELLRKLALCGAQALIVSAEWPLIRLNHWQTLLKARAIENQYYVLAANNVTFGEAPFAGHSVAHGPDGSTLAQFEFGEDVKVVNINKDTVNTIRANVPVFKDRRPELY